MTCLLVPVARRGRLARSRGKCSMTYGYVINILHYIASSIRHYVILVYKKESKARVARVVVIRYGQCAGSCNHSRVAAQLADYTLLVVVA